MKVSELAPLVALATSMDDAARLRLAEAARVVRGIEDEIAALARSRADAAVLATPGGMQAHMLHQRWTLARREALLRHLAEARGQFEAARLVAAKAYGRKTALDDLLVEAKRTAQGLRDRRLTAQLADSTEPPGPRAPG